MEKVAFTGSKLVQLGSWSRRAGRAKLGRLELCLDVDKSGRTAGSQPTSVHSRAAVSAVKASPNVSGKASMTSSRLPIQAYHLYEHTFYLCVLGQMILIF